MSARPSIRARDSAGRQVSLLNDEPLNRSIYQSNFALSATDAYDSASTGASSPRTPSLLRAESCDSQHSNGPVSPTTPTFYEYNRQQTFKSAYPDPSQYDERHSIYPENYPEKHYSQSSASRPTFNERSSTCLYEQDENMSGPSDRSGGSKRYPCRFKDSHGCDKSFTTSGHASRHSKIHTAEKAVHCSFQGCQKKFTRADNMKQHLETHFKERARASTHKPAPPGKLSIASGVRKNSTSSGRVSRPASRNDIHLEYDGYINAMSPTSSTYSDLGSPLLRQSSLDMSHIQRSLPSADRTQADSTRLEALASICVDRR